MRTARIVFALLACFGMASGLAAQPLNKKTKVVNVTEANLYFNMSSGVSGVVFPEGSSSVLFFGTQGTGVPCYGEGTPDRSRDRQPVAGTGGAVVYCYDPASGGKGSTSRAPRSIASSVVRSDGERLWRAVDADPSGFRSLREHG